MKKITTFFASFFLSLVLVVAGFVLLVNYCGRGVCEQAWYREMYPLKAHLAKAKTGPKIIIIGGSSSLFGINGEKLEEYSGMSVVNFSMSILIPMRFYLADLEEFVEPGDVVVIPLELTNHHNETEEKLFSNFGVSLLFSGNHATQKTLTTRELCSLYCQYGFSWINSTLFHPDGTLMRLFGDREKQGVLDGVYKEEYVMALHQRHQAAKQPGSGPDFYADLSSCGDWPMDLPAAKTDIQPYGLSNAVTEEFVYSAQQIQKFVESRGATLLFVWPNDYFYPEHAGIEKFRDLLAANGVTLCGRPEASSFPKCFYHEPIHHMNRQGAELWTYELAKTISRATGKPLKKRNAAWPYIVFADDPAGYFPDATAPQIYDTGVRIAQQKFVMQFAVPEPLRGKKLELNIVALPEPNANPVFAKIAVDGKDCPVTELRYAERMEANARIPAECTQTEQITLECEINGDSIGMERLFFREEPKLPAIEFGSGFANPEPWGRWTVGKQAELGVLIMPELRGKALKMEWSVYTFVAGEQKPECNFRILSGGKVLYTGVSNQFETTFSLNVPAEYTGETYVPLVIEVENPVSPQELGLPGNDPRALGVGVKSITVTE